MIIEKTYFRIGSVIKSKKIELAVEANPTFYFFILQCINRHKGNDWGDCSEENWTKNDDAAFNNKIIHSEYNLPKGLTSIDAESTILIISNQVEEVTHVIFSSEK